MIEAQFKGEAGCGEAGAIINGSELLETGIEVLINLNCGGNSLGDEKLCTKGSILMLNSWIIGIAT